MNRYTDETRGTNFSEGEMHHLSSFYLCRTLTGLFFSVCGVVVLSLGLHADVPAKPVQTPSMQAQAFLDEVLKQEVQYRLDHGDVGGGTRDFLSHSESNSLLDTQVSRSLRQMSRQPVEVRREVLRYCMTAPYASVFGRHARWFVHACVGLDQELRQDVIASLILPEIDQPPKDLQVRWAIMLLGRELQMKSGFPGWARYVAETVSGTPTTLTINRKWIDQVKREGDWMEALPDSFSITLVNSLASEIETQRESTFKIVLEGSREVDLKNYRPGIEEFLAIESAEFARKIIRAEFRKSEDQAWRELLLGSTPLTNKVLPGQAHQIDRLGRLILSCNSEAVRSKLLQTLKRVPGGIPESLALEFFTKYGSAAVESSVSICDAMQPQCVPGVVALLLQQRKNQPLQATSGFSFILQQACDQADGPSAIKTLEQFRIWLEEHQSSSRISGRAPILGLGPILRTLVEKIPAETARSYLPSLTMDCDSAWFHGVAIGLSRSGLLSPSETLDLVKSTQRPGMHGTTVVELCASLKDDSVEQAVDSLLSVIVPRDGRPAARVTNQAGAKKVVSAIDAADAAARDASKAVQAATGDSKAAPPETAPPVGSIAQQLPTTGERVRACMGLHALAKRLTASQAERATSSIASIVSTPLTFGYGEERPPGDPRDTAEVTQLLREIVYARPTSEHPALLRTLIDEIIGRETAASPLAEELAKSIPDKECLPVVKHALSRLLWKNFPQFSQGSLNDMFPCFEILLGRLPTASRIKVIDQLAKQIIELIEMPELDAIQSGCHHSLTRHATALLIGFSDDLSPQVATQLVVKGMKNCQERGHRSSLDFIQLTNFAPRVTRVEAVAIRKQLQERNSTHWEYLLMDACLPLPLDQEKTEQLITSMFEGDNLKNKYYIPAKALARNLPISLQRKYLDGLAVRCQNAYGVFRKEVLWTSDKKTLNILLPALRIAVINNHQFGLVLNDLDRPIPPTMRSELLIALQEAASKDPLKLYRDLRDPRYDKQRQELETLITTLPKKPKPLPEILLASGSMYGFPESLKDRKPPLSDSECITLLASTSTVGSRRDALLAHLVRLHNLEVPITEQDNLWAILTRLQAKGISVVPE